MNTTITFAAPLVILALLFAPLVNMYFKAVKGKKLKLSFLFNLCSFAGVVLLTAVFGGNISAFAAAATDTATTAASSAGLGYLSAALSTGIASIGAGIALASGAPAAIGALSEDSKTFGKALIFLALGEGIALYGLLISILIINNL